MDRRGGDEGRNKRRMDGYGEDGGRQEGGRWSAQDDYYYQGYQERFPEPRYQEQRDNWGLPPPWWIEEQKRKRKAEASKARGGQGASQGQGARGSGSLGGAGGSSGQPNKKT
jgi:hypothetical protein